MTDQVRDFPDLRVGGGVRHEAPMRPASIVLITFVAGSYLSGPASATETAIVVDRDGVGASAKFGDKVEVEVGPSGSKILLGGEEYPRASFAFQEDGCFAIGIEAGIENGVFENAEFRGTGAYYGPDSVEFSATVSQEISAEVEICPSVEEPFLVAPTLGGGDGDAGTTQRMLITGVSRPGAAGPGEQVDAGLEAYCRDRSLKEPGSDTKLEVDTEFTVSTELRAVLDHRPRLHPRLQSQCIWAAYPAEYWPMTVARLLRSGDVSPDDMAALRARIQEELRTEEELTERFCGFRPALEVAVSDSDLDGFSRCFQERTAGAADVDDDLTKEALASCSARQVKPRPRWWLVAGALAACSVVGIAGIWYARRRRPGTE